MGYTMLYLITNHWQIGFQGVRNTTRHSVGYRKATADRSLMTVNLAENLRMLASNPWHDNKIPPQSKS